jgi:hypothetical protein
MCETQPYRYAMASRGRQTLNEMRTLEAFCLVIWTTNQKTLTQPGFLPQCEAESCPRQTSRGQQALSILRDAKQNT